ncbi:MAG: tRNA uridine-5-carboxymethylaminomethyl(34) synthesis GTPase MnmE [Christensenellales bacterium]
MRAATIAALATAPGRGGIAIIRISGPEAEATLMRIFRPADGRLEFPSHLMRYGRLADEAGQIDEGMAVLMKAPRSYTREDVAELHLHGGEYVVERALQLLWRQGLRPADPGEFTRRAFLNGRLDLGQAEAVMQLIDATGQRAARAALRDLQGGGSAFIRQAQEVLLDILAGVAAALDYPEEINEAEALLDLQPRTGALAARLLAACDERGVRILEEGLEVAIVGKPNVGKSSLLNLLLQEERAIVTDEAGTTRDIVRGSISLDGVRINLSDTAGIRPGGQKAEAIGIQRARQAVEKADLVLAVLDSASALSPEDEEVMRLIAPYPHVLILNKDDLSPEPGLPEGIRISARTGEGLGTLKQAIADAAGHPGEGALTNARHMSLARQAAESLRQAAQAMGAGEPLDLLAVDLHEALRLLGDITGEGVDEALLDRVFLRFCVGK